jgi:hypothetical protein
MRVCVYICMNIYVHIYISNPRVTLILFFCTHAGAIPDSLEPMETNARGYYSTYRLLRNATSKGGRVAPDAAVAVPVQAAAAHVAREPSAVPAARPESEAAHVAANVRTRVCVCMCVYVCMHTHTHTPFSFSAFCMRVCVYICMNIHVHIYIYIYVCVCVCAMQLDVGYLYSFFVCMRAQFRTHWNQQRQRHVDTIALCYACIP